MVTLWRPTHRCGLNGIVHQQSPIADRLQPSPGIFLETTAQHAAKTRRRRGRQCVPRRLRLEHRGQRVGDGLSGMKPLAREHFEEHHTKRPYIGAMIDRLSARLFRTHVRGRPEDDAHLRHRGSGDGRRQRWVARARRPFHRLRQTEVEHLHRAVRLQRDVGGLQVTMDDTSFVRGLESISDLVGDGDGLAERHWPLRDAIGERLSLDEFEDERVNVGRVLEAVDRRDVRVVE